MFSKKGFFAVCLVILTALLITGCAPTTPMPVAVTGVTLDQATMTLTAGGATGTLVATVAPANATNQTVTWSSSAPAVATVANGVVTPGIADITGVTVTTVDGGFTATCIVIVAAKVYTIGETGPAGGLIFYDKGYVSDGWRYLEAAPSDQSTGIQWYNGSNVDTGAIGSAIGTGQANTTAIAAKQGAGSYAAQLCNDLTVGGYSDWFLPSKDELNQMYLNLKKQGVGGFASDYYWNSLEYTTDSAWDQYFGNGQQYYGNPKSIADRVRAARAF